MHPLAFPKHSTMFPLPQTQYDAPVGHHTGEGNMALQWSGCPLSKKGRWPSQVYVRILPSEFQNRNWNSLRVYSAIRFSLAFGYADPLWLGQKYSKLCDSTMEETPTTEDEEHRNGFSKVGMWNWQCQPKWHECAWLYHLSAWFLLTGEDRSVTVRHKVTPVLSPYVKVTF